jgi:hypothetical protein
LSRTTPKLWATRVVEATLSAEDQQELDCQLEKVALVRSDLSSMMKAVKKV